MAEFLLRFSRSLPLIAAAAVPLVGGCIGSSFVPAEGRVATSPAFKLGLHIETAGEGSPVVLIHGGGLDSRMWDRQFARLADNHLVVRYDVRGYGRSKDVLEPFSHVADLGRVMDAAGAEAATLIGLSLGGAIAIDFALAHPSRVHHLLLAAPAVSGVSGVTEDPDRFRRIHQLAAAGKTEEIVAEWLGGPHMSPAMENPAIAATIRTMALDNHQSWRPPDNSMVIATPAAAGRLHQVRAPTRVLVGDRDDRGARELAERVSREIPGAQLTIVPGAGHILNLEAPEFFDAWVTEALSPAPVISKSVRSHGWRQGLLSIVIRQDYTTPSVRARAARERCRP